MCLLTNNDPYYLFSAIVFMNGRAIHPANVLYGNGSTKKSELTLFLKRVQKFPHMKYFVVGVNSLSFESQTLLFKWVSSFVTSMYKIYLTNNIYRGYTQNKCKRSLDTYIWSLLKRMGWTTLTFWSLLSFNPIVSFAYTFIQQHKSVTLK